MGSKGHHESIEADVSKRTTYNVKLHASNITVSMLSDQAFLVVRSDIGEPIYMLSKLYALHA